MTQNALILRELVRQHGRWVPMPELAWASGAFDVKIEGTRPRRSFYRLVSPVQEVMAI